MNSQLLHLLLFIEVHLKNCIRPPPREQLQENELLTFDVYWRKNFKSNIVNMCALITTVITTKYLDGPEVAGCAVGKVSAAL